MDDKELLKKYNLPSEEELTAELGSYDSEDKGLIITIIGALREKAQKYLNFLEEMLHPDSTITSMQEASMFSNEERIELFILFKQFTLLQRKMLLIHLTTSEEEKVAYFKEYYAFFQASKPQLKTSVEKALSVWSAKEIKAAAIQGYFG